MLLLVSHSASVKHFRIRREITKFSQFESIFVCASVHKNYDKRTNHWIKRSKVCFKASVANDGNVF